MRRLIVALPGIVAALLLSILCGPALAQYCGEVPIQEAVVYCCGGLYQQPDIHCGWGPGGSCSYACYQGSGQCCNFPYGTANTAFDGNCPSQLNCEDGWVFDDSTCRCRRPSPIIIDVGGNGFHLTNASGGVLFQFAPNQARIQTAWTEAGVEGDAFLALDRNNDNRINDGTELFGNLTQQPRSHDPNGFLALAEFDKPENGGNGDGIIDSHDIIYTRLRLWIDTNHNGVSQPEELHPLSELGVFSLGLHYRESRREDQFGNSFRYKAAVNPNNDGESRDGRWAYDVFFVSGDDGLSGNFNSSSRLRRCPAVRGSTATRPLIMREDLLNRK